VQTSVVIQVPGVNITILPLAPGVSLGVAVPVPSSAITVTANSPALTARDEIVPQVFVISGVVAADSPVTGFTAAQPPRPLFAADSPAIIAQVLVNSPAISFATALPQIASFSVDFSIIENIVASSSPAVGFASTQPVQPLFSADAITVGSSVGPALTPRFTVGSQPIAYTVS
jgi:hypothetical protein